MNVDRRGLVLGSLVSLICLWLAFKDIRWQGFVDALGATDYPLLALAVGIFVATNLLKAARWRLLFAPRHVRLGPLFSALMIGQMVNALLPARLGELARAYLMGERERQSKGLALGTIALEKLIELIVLLVLFLGLVPFLALPVWLYQPGITLALITAALCLAALVLAYRRQAVLSMWNRLLGGLPALARPAFLQEAEAALQSLDILRRPRLILSIWGWSVLIWSLAIATNYVVFLAMGLSLSMLVAAFLLVVLQIGIAVPSSPGKVGVFHYLTVLALSVFGAQKDVALSYAVVLHLVIYVPVIVLGVFYLWRENLTLTHVLRNRV